LGHADVGTILNAASHRLQGQMHLLTDTLEGA
jgi:hypothetical protein